MWVGNDAYNKAYSNAYTTSGSSLNAWAMQAIQATNVAGPQPVRGAKKKPETAVAWLREQVDEVTQLAA